MREGEFSTRHGRCSRDWSLCAEESAWKRWKRDEEGTSLAFATLRLAKQGMGPLFQSHGSGEVLAHFFSSSQLN
jgi:hypothetical protein